MPSSMSDSMIQRRIPDSPEPAAPENSGEPESTIPIREPCFILAIMCCRNSSEPSLTRGRPAPKRPVKPWGFASSCSGLE